ncbi:MAG: DNA-directed DNA polymerase II small subunit [Methanomicrobiaceae archaeon]|nr:DNA-directed DNA polymerase II small subunit [Methanomicrobiaceae archaeon]
MLGNQEIVQRFLQTNLQVHPDVVRYLREKKDPSLIDEILSNVPEGAVVVSPHYLPGWKREKDGERFLADPALEVVYGNSSRENGGVELKDFMYYFRDRYTQLSSIIRQRTGAMPIEALTRSTRYRQQDCTVIGMVMEVRTSANGHRIAELEDATGTLPVLFNKDRDVFADAEKLVPDEVVGVVGRLSGDGTMFFAETLLRPDIPLNHAPFTSRTPGNAILISDLHVGSNTFLKDEWNRFIEWISENDAGYLLIAGDCVDGIGIYPGQEKELDIANIYEQYDALGEMLKDLPSRLQIVIAPGNHDAVRGSEPQPALPERFTNHFPKNVTLVENPSMVSLQGVHVLMYHGRSFDDLIGMIPGATYTRPDEMMEEMLRRRHLAPSYGLRTPIMAGRQDRLVISPIPEILHTGHIHICGISRYRGVLEVNAGTWQGQTTFQKQMNIQPTPARAVVVDLQTLQPSVIDFLHG